MLFEFLVKPNNKKGENMKYIIKKEKPYYELVCAECGETISSLPLNFEKEDMSWIEDVVSKHQEVCGVTEVVKEDVVEVEEDYEDDIVCPHCGEVLASYYESYRRENPNAFYEWREALILEHSPFCRGDE